MPGSPAASSVHATRVPNARARARFVRAALRLGVLALALVAGSAAAQPKQSVSLIYETDPGLIGCPSMLEFQRSVVQQLGYDPFADGAPRTVSVRASLTSSGVAGNLVWRDARGETRGERKLVAEHRDCAELARSVAFAIVVQLQLLDTSSERDAPPESPPKRDLPLVVEERDPVDPLPPPERDPDTRGWLLQLGAGPTGALGLAPDPTLLGRLFGQLRYEDISVELGGTASWTTSVVTQDGSGLESNVASVTLAPCYHSGPFAGCASSHVGRLFARGTGIDAPQEGSGLLAGVGGRLAVSHPIGPIIASLRFEGLYNLTRWTVELNDAAVWTTPDAVFLAGLDFALPVQLSR